MTLPAVCHGWAALTGRPCPGHCDGHNGWDSCSLLPSAPCVVPSKTMKNSPQGGGLGSVPAQTLKVCVMSLAFGRHPGAMATRRHPGAMATGRHPGAVVTGRHPGALAIGSIVLGLSWTDSPD